MAAPKAIAKGMQNTVNEFMSNPQKVLLKAKKAIGKMAAEYLWVGIILILLGISWYYQRQINKKANDNYAMESTYNDKESVGPAPTTTSPFTKYRAKSNTLAPW